MTTPDHVPSRASVAAWAAVGIDAAAAAEFDAVGMIPSLDWPDWQLSWGTRRDAWGATTSLTISAGDIANLFATGISAAEANLWITCADTFPSEIPPVIQAGWSREDLVDVQEAIITYPPPRAPDFIGYMIRTLALWVASGAPPRRAALAIRAGLTPTELDGTGDDALSLMGALRAHD